MTTILLVRHAAAAVVDRLCGRTPGIPLSPAGRRQAAALAERLAGVPLAAVYSSPLERTRETTGAIAAAHQVEPIVSEPLGEVDFGEWTGLSFADLDQRPEWRRFNAVRSLAHPPGGERFVEVQRRAVAELQRLATRHPGAIVAAVTHADVIRAVVTYVLGMPIDLFARLEILPASVTILRLDAAEAPRLAGLNLVDRLDELLGRG